METRRAPRSARRKLSLMIPPILRAFGARHDHDDDRAGERQRAHVGQTFNDFLLESVQDVGAAQPLLAKPGDQGTGHFSTGKAGKLLGAQAGQAVTHEVVGSSLLKDPIGTNLEVTGRLGVRVLPGEPGARQRAGGRKSHKVSRGSTEETARDLKVMSLASCEEFLDEEGSSRACRDRKSTRLNSSH